MSVRAANDFTAAAMFRKVVSGILGLLILAGICASSEAASGNPLKMTGCVIAGDAGRVRLVVQFDREPDPRWFLLRGPHRLVIDLPDTDFAIDPKMLKARGLIRGVRYGRLDEHKSRLVLTAKKPFVVENLEIAANEQGGGYRMVADIAAATQKDFDTALAAQAETTASTRSTPKQDRVGKVAAPDGKQFTVVIDAGHGGFDGGAESPGGTVEKSITLAFALELRAALEAERKYNIVMTRDKDEFLSLGERVNIARKHNADLLISIHADTIRVKNVRGATVYTVSDKASDAESEATAARENLSDQLAGIEFEEEKREVADILVDLIRRETHSFSMSFARTLVARLSDSIEMIKNPHRYAGFRVLKAPDVPSVLVELGYLSNPKDEKELRSAEWRGRAIAGISAAIDHFAAAKQGTGG